MFISEPVNSSFNLLPSIVDITFIILYIQGFQQSGDHIHVENSHGLHEPANFAQPALTAPVTIDHAVERRKLNLKPRSPSREQLERNVSSRWVVTH